MSGPHAQYREGCILGTCLAGQTPLSLAPEAFILSGLRNPDCKPEGAPRVSLKKTTMSGGNVPGDGDADLAVKTRPRTKRPPMYKVLLMNDDFTPMEFVVLVLERFFAMNQAQAFEIMLTVHKKGLAVVGVFSHEIAETKVNQVLEMARENQHPLQCTMEKE